jgi:hypothetical protein
MGVSPVHREKHDHSDDRGLPAAPDVPETDDLGESSLQTDFVLETGLKFRAQIGSTPLKFLSFFTDFWGIRAGIKNYGFFDIDQLTYVLEVGAGSF